MRVIDCNHCGETVSAANDAELARAFCSHVNSEHPDVDCDEDQAAEWVSEQAYDATDS